MERINPRKAGKYQEKGEVNSEGSNKGGTYNAIEEQTKYIKKQCKSQKREDTKG